MNSSKTEFLVTAAFVTAGAAMSEMPFQWLLFLGPAFGISASFFSSRRIDLRGPLLGLLVLSLGVLCYVLEGRLNGEAVTAKPPQIPFLFSFRSACLLALILEWRLWRDSRSSCNKG